MVFLACYLTYHYKVHGSIHYPNPGPIRYVYYTILITHTMLAVTVPVLAIITLNRALKARFDKHRKIARWTFPIWLYVSYRSHRLPDALSVRESDHSRRDDTPLSFGAAPRGHRLTLGNRRTTRGSGIATEKGSDSTKFQAVRVSRHIIYL